MAEKFLPIIPFPANMELKNNEGFTLNSDTRIVVSPELKRCGLFLKEKLSKESGIELPLYQKGENKISDNRENMISLELVSSLRDFKERTVPENEEEIIKEGYILKSGISGITLTSVSEEGIFRGIQTLRQLFPIDNNKDDSERLEGLSIPSVDIFDMPRFSWRGYMLDVSRHFNGVKTVKQIIDAMSLMKMNILHLHLCDDQGWRIQIDKYPNLTEKGAFRKETKSKGFLGRKGDGNPHGGFFTKDDIREIVSYAAESFITVIPEIEMPGHCSAALASYPELGCRGTGYEIATGPGIYKDIYCPGKDFTYEFLKNVIDEVIELFPAKWIHIGGDEAPLSRWKNCPYCREKIAKEGLEGEKDLQHYFMDIMTAYIREKGRIPIAWNDILREDTSSETVIQYWLRGENNVKDHLSRGGKVVASNFFNTYLDYNHGVLPLSKIYSYNPFVKGLDARYRKNILGLEAPLWTESAKTLEHIHAFTFPRIVALAENAWTEEARKDFNSFRVRLNHFLERIRLMGISHTDINSSDPGFFKRLKMWKKIYRQSSILPDKIIKAEHQS